MTRIVRLAAGDDSVVLAGAELFDAAPTETWTATFLSSEGHHLLVAVDDDDTPIGFVSGVETTHPDKGTEMFLYELSVHADSAGRVSAERSSTRSPSSRASAAATACGSRRSRTTLRRSRRTAPPAPRFPSRA